ncbi:hypothetical protein QR680_011547 [Steinernema hermaphroditum]|uniref:Peptidase S1 domain-containing protein n=1 Tax=Steinernema hermaphroditum TaxID=289476 RepID=A0AA39HYV5_9BILA|nr:hypothetical protein QR680_011547 [Steinernema hermaphroditum]
MHLLMCFFALGVLHVSCFKDDDITEGITNGDVAPRGSFPYHVYIEFRAHPTKTPDYARKMCGGALISARHVLTSAICAERDVPTEVMVGSELALGGPGQQWKNIVARHVHEDFNEYFHNDIAILEIEPVELNNTTQIIALPESDDNLLPARCNITGHGFYSYSDNLANKSALDTEGNWTDVLLFATLDIQTFEYCINRTIIDLQWNMTLTESQICTGRGDTASWAYLHLRGPALGDKGDPIVAQKDSKKWLVGINSYFPRTLTVGDLMRRQERYPHIITRVSKYCDWIEKVSGVSCKPV